MESKCVGIMSSSSTMESVTFITNLLIGVVATNRNFTNLKSYNSWSHSGYNACNGEPWPQKSLRLQDFLKPTSYPSLATEPPTLQIQITNLSHNKTCSHTNNLKWEKKILSRNVERIWKAPRNNERGQRR